jgi:beta-N-acetylhexosaminidase
VASFRRVETAQPGTVLKILNIALLALRLAVAAGLFAFALYWRSPVFASARMFALVAFLVVAAALIVFEIVLWVRTSRTRLTAVLSGAALAIAGGALALTVIYEAQFRWQRHHVLGADAAAIEQIGRHFIVGYRDFDELRSLVERRAVAGVFVSAHNVRGKDVQTIRRDIAFLQSIRARQGLPQLLIATDQEGGMVSRMSPPLDLLTTLGEIVRSHHDAAERSIAVRQYAAKQGRALAKLGFNLNFSPVVDLNHSVVNPNDRYTRITERAISADPKIVTAVAGEYCDVLLQTGVHCTLKHFPGLGRVVEDTHTESADLSTEVKTLADTDWVPFRELMHTAGAFTMLSHARLTAVDRDTPASFSAPVVSGLLRGEWKHNGVLVTDDFSMGAAYSSAEGLAGAGLAALNAGVDLILVSYDPDQFYPIVHALIRAGADGRLRKDVLERSDRRLAEVLPVNQGHAAVRP